MDANENLLDSFESLGRKTNFQVASKEKRIGNYIIDRIGYYVFAFLVGSIYGILSNLSGVVDDLGVLEESSILRIEDYIFGIVVITIYYTLQEYFLKGKTLGKFITKTRAVTEDDQPLTFGNAIGRSLCRLIPFEAFSFLGESESGWHDRFSKTKVILDENWDSDYL